ncbi:DUF115 domain-containing protein [Clostridiaceae bacterium M8S5]|nr:DUF115 domain-containing protein [Clostridiaceae bacterium M8S5]
MNKNLYKHNLNILNELAISEDMITDIKNYRMPKEIKNQETKDGYLTFRYDTDTGKKIYVHSMYNVNREIESTFANIEFDKDCIYFVYGLGMGYHIEELKKKISPKSMIFVIEKDFNIVKNFLENKDIVNIIGNNVLFFFGNEAAIISEVSKKIMYFNVLPLFANMQIVTLPSYKKIYENWIVDVNKRLVDVVKHSLFMLGNDMDDTIIGIKNNFDNIVELIKSSDFKCVKDKYKDSPLIIVSAGPSLDKNIEELKNAAGKAIIIATDATLTTLRKHGIVPDGVVSIERILLTYEKFYKDKDIDKNTVLISPPVIRKEIFEQLKDNKKLICLKKGEKINEWINDDILGEDRLLQMGSSCAHIAFSFGKHIGANPIIFVGQDLAFTKEGITHQSDVEVLDKVDCDNREDIVYVKGVDGDMLPTNYAYKNFLTWFEIMIAEDRSSREYIDATEGGALINGTKIMTLKDTIDKYCNKKVISLNECLSEENLDISKLKKALEEVDNLNKFFDDIRQAAGRHILRLDKLEKKIILKKDISQKLLIKSFDTLNKARKIETMIFKNDIARTLFQAPMMMALTKIKMLGNKIIPENIKENVAIQKNMTGAIITGCYGVQLELVNIMDNLTKTLSEEGGNI